MKTVQLLFILTALFTLLSISGCNDCQSDLEAKNKEVVQLAADALNNYDYESVEKYYAGDFHRYCQATPEAKVESLDDFIALVKMWEVQFPDGRMEIHQMIAEGDLVAIHVTYSGTNLGAMGDIPATGKKMSIECFGYHRLKDGKITETWITWDNLTSFVQLGLMPPPAKKKP